MKRLTTDIHLGSSTSQLLAHMKRNETQAQAIPRLAKILQHTAKTKPKKYARRCACLMGLIYEEFNADEWLLDVLIGAMQLNETED